MGELVSVSTGPPLWRVGGWSSGEVSSGHPPAVSLSAFSIDLGTLVI